MGLYFKQYTHLSPRDDWVVVEHGVTAPVRSSCVDQQSSYDDTAEEEEDGMKIEIAVSPPHSSMYNILNWCIRLSIYPLVTIPLDPPLVHTAVL